jgi:hypothetical protein
LGKTLLPQTLCTLLKNSFHGTKTPNPDKSGAVYEILRVGANLCMDHGMLCFVFHCHKFDGNPTDENRGALLEAGFPQTILSLLEGYAESIPSSRHFNDPLSLPISDLKIVKTSIGVILNACLGYGALNLHHQAVYS